MGLVQSKAVSHVATVLKVPFKLVVTSFVNKTSIRRTALQSSSFTRRRKREAYFKVDDTQEHIQNTVK